MYGDAIDFGMAVRSVAEEGGEDGEPVSEIDNCRSKYDGGSAVEQARTLPVSP